MSTREDPPRVLVQVYKGTVAIQCEPGVDLIHLDYDIDGRSDVEPDALGTLCRVVHRGLVSDDVELSADFDEHFKPRGV